MTRVAHMREPVERRPRRFLTERQKDSVYASHGGLCGLCEAPVGRLEAQWDHIIERDLTQCDDTDQFWPVHPTCHKAKSAKRAPVLAKVHRLCGQTGHAYKRPIGRRADPWPPAGSRKLRSRGSFR